VAVPPSSLLVGDLFLVPAAFFAVCVTFRLTRTDVLFPLGADPPDAVSLHRRAWLPAHSLIPFFLGMFYRPMLVCFTTLSLFTKGSFCCPLSFALAADSNLFWFPFPSLCYTSPFAVRRRPCTMGPFYLFRVLPLSDSIDVVQPYKDGGLSSV